MTDYDPFWYADPKLHSDDYFVLFRAGTPPEEMAKVSEATVDRLVEYLGLKPGAKVLDLACGWGRIAIPLARRGFQVTGVDLSQDFLAKADSAAGQAGLALRLVRSDMRNIPFEAEFDAVVIMGGSFGQLESDEAHEEVLASMNRSLKSSGKCLIEFRNREWLIRNYRERDWNEWPYGTIVVEDRRLELAEGRNYVHHQILEPDGTRRDYHHIMRLYTLVEMVKMLAAAGLSSDGAWGDWSGGDYTIRSPLMIVRASKAA